MTLFLIENWDGANWVNANYSDYYDFTDAFGNNYSFSGVKVEIYYKIITNVEEENISFAYTLRQNYPNPFNPSTIISYSIPQSGLVQLKVYDLLGREVADLVSEEQSVGNYKIEFNATNLTSGVYFYRLQSSSFVQTKKLILLR